jgi:uncharacterized membrane protein YcgQ (UPF0703/DUF1980 family)
MNILRHKIPRLAGALTLTAVLTAALAGCGGGAEAAQPRQSNNNGTQAVDISGAPAGAGEALFAPDGEVFEIREKMFVSQINDIYLNAEDYLGRVLRYEGIFKEDVYPEWDAVYYYVVRYGPGCCGTDSNPGFEVIWEEGGEYPAQDEWVEATGVLEAYEEEGYEYLRLRLSSLEVMEARGAEYVSQ